MFSVSMTCTSISRLLHARHGGPAAGGEAAEHVPGALQPGVGRPHEEALPPLRHHRRERLQGVHRSSDQAGMKMKHSEFPIKTADPSSSK